MSFHGIAEETSLGLRLVCPSPPLQFPHGLNYRQEGLTTGATREKPLVPGMTRRFTLPVV
jgi:hypothetical protein